MSKVSERQDFIRFYKEQAGVTEVDMHEVAKLAAQKGWPLPKPTDPLDLLTKQFTDAALQDIRYDKNTNRPSRAYHAVPTRKNSRGQMMFSWIDIDDPNTTPKNFRKSSVMRRNQMVDDGVQLSLDLDHWNNIHPTEADQVHLPWDLTLDIEIRRASLDEQSDESAA